MYHSRPNTSSSLGPKEREGREEKNKKERSCLSHVAVAISNIALLVGQAKIDIL